ncbi:MAG: hypothetical protein JW744_02135 [Candidatus Diapherotrites archaeon]|uniref:Uncharacterized protein n=1 Tax=Candidatus Iainarchaeum sp. TaxID=3101447 RepID=A0A938YXP4_9ARCH|nr:hypothetical protein [Candidatus Diapherotrites archaeon]
MGKGLRHNLRRARRRLFSKFVRAKRRTEFQQRFKPSDMQEGLALGVVSSLRVEKAIPEVERLVKEAHAKIRASGLSEKYFGIDDSIVNGGVKWIPQEKREAASFYVLLKMAGIELKAEQIKALGLEKDIASLNRLIEIS